VATPSLLTTAAPKQNHRYAIWQRRYAPYLFISPFFILFAVFGLFPTLFSLYLSFTRWNPLDGLANIKFVGLENYQFLLTDDTLFRKSLINTAVLGVISGIPQHIIAIPLAFLLHTGLNRIKGFVTALYFAPYVTSVAAIAMVFGTLYSERSGLFNWALAQLHQIPLLGAAIPGDPIPWLGREVWIKPSIALLIAWRYTGWNTVLYLSAMQAVPMELFEAAAVDGASRWQQFRFITLPLLRPMAFYAVTLTIIGNMQIFVEPFLLVNRDGGVNNAGLTTVMYLYKTAFNDLDMGLAASISWVLFAIIIALTLINNRIFRGGRAD
jgi:multiple sugar transport system permease protein